VPTGFNIPVANGTYLITQINLDLTFGFVPLRNAVDSKMHAKQSSSQRLYS
jgi:hypothetical protein